jgi:hypothetical protein
MMPKTATKNRAGTAPTEAPSSNGHAPADEPGKRTEAERVLAALIDKSAELYDHNHEATELRNDIKQSEATLTDLCLDLGLRKLCSDDGKHEFIMAGKLRAVKAAQSSMDGAWTKIAESVDKIEGYFDETEGATSFHNGQARDVLKELVEGFGCEACELAAEETCAAFDKGDAIVDQIAFYRERCRIKKQELKMPPDAEEE